MLKYLVWHKCAYCGAEFRGSPKRRFCSPTCRRRFRSGVAVRKRLQTDPEFKRRSLERLQRWKEMHKKERGKAAGKTVNGGDYNVRSEG